MASFVVILNIHCFFCLKSLGTNDILLDWSYLKSCAHNQQLFPYDFLIVICFYIINVIHLGIISLTTIFFRFGSKHLFFILSLNIRLSMCSKTHMLQSSSFDVFHLYFLVPVSRHRTLMNLFNKVPMVDKDAFVAPSASLIGDVHVGHNASIWYGCVLRGMFYFP